MVQIKAIDLQNDIRCNQLLFMCGTLLSGLEWAAVWSHCFKGHHKQLFTEKIFVCHVAQQSCSLQAAPHCFVSMRWCSPALQWTGEAHHLSPCPPHSIWANPYTVFHLTTCLIRVCSNAHVEAIVISTKKPESWYYLTN